jgi:hypothetical protein
MPRPSGVCCGSNPPRSALGSLPRVQGVGNEFRAKQSLFRPTWHPQSTRIVAFSFPKWKKSYTSTLWRDHITQGRERDVTNSARDPESSQLRANAPMWLRGDPYLNMDVGSIPVGSGTSMFIPILLLTEY